MNIGLYFGTFNPIHVGHMIIGNHLAEHTKLDEVWFVVTPHNPFKNKRTLLSDHHRFQTVLIATDDFKKLKPSKVEFSLPQPNYTINTLAYLYEKYPQHEFSLIMGEDNLQNFHKWKNSDVILKNHDIYVYPRVFNNKKDSPLIKHPKVHLIEAPIVEISSTFIRDSIRDKKEVRPLLPLKVWNYIDDMNFYK